MRAAVVSKVGEPLEMKKLKRMPVGRKIYARMLCADAIFNGSERVNERRRRADP